MIDRIRNWLCGGSTNEDGAAADSDRNRDRNWPCDEYGHEYRDGGESEIVSKTIKREENSHIWLGYKLNLIPGYLIGVHHIQTEETIPCRDCPKTKKSITTIQTILLYRDKDGLDTMTKDEYLEREKEDRTNDGNS